MKLNSIMYIDGGDVTRPYPTGRKVCIVHCVNDLWVMGSGVARALFMKWPAVRSEYLEWGKTNPPLGEVQFVQVGEETIVANMVGQHGIGLDEHGNPPIRYDAFKVGLEKVCDFCLLTDSDLHLPYLMGADLAGGDWTLIEKIIREKVFEKGVNVYMYDLFSKREEMVYNRERDERNNLFDAV